MICRGCYKEAKEGYCNTCRNKLFDGFKIPSVLLFDAPSAANLESFQDHSKRLSISGVQLKYSLKLEDKNLELCEKGSQYILKPIPIARQLQQLNDAPENEHLTMQIAEQVFGISTAANALIYFKDGHPAYITRRFDVKPGGGKYMQEDFAQLTKRTQQSHGEIFKYEGSYEETGNLINRFTAAAMPSVEKFFYQVVFNYVLSNGDAHLKNFSIMRDDKGEYKLTPAYDLLCSVLHTPQESDAALDLYEQDVNSDFYSEYGYYGRPNFMELAKRIGVVEKRATRIMDAFIVKQKNVIDFVGKSFLSDDMKTRYAAYFNDKVKRIE